MSASLDRRASWLACGFLTVLLSACATLDPHQDLQHGSSPPVTAAAHRAIERHAPSTSEPAVKPVVANPIQSVEHRSATEEPGADELTVTNAQSSINRAAASQTRAVDLPTVLTLVNGQNPQVMYARERIQEAFAQWERAQVLWLPSLRLGTNWNKHEGKLQDVAGSIIDTSRGSYFTGFGADAVGAGSPRVPGLIASFHLTDAIFQPRIAEQTTGSRQFGSIAATNDMLLDAALAYLEVLRANEEQVIAEETLDHTQQLANLTATFAATGQGVVADDDRARAELALRQNDVQRAQEAVQTASARLGQILHLDPTLRFIPTDPAVVPIEMTAADTAVADLVAQGLTQRPEVSESRFLVGEAVERLQREKYAPLIPSVLLGLSYGGLGGGLGSNLSNFGNRLDADAVAYWEIRNLGFGERAARAEAQSRIQQAQWREIAALDRVAREVVEAQGQVSFRKQQIATAEEGILLAQHSYERNLLRIRNLQGLPIEALQSIQALSQARREYLRVVLGYNEAQFRLHHSIGWPGVTPGA